MSCVQRRVYRASGAGALVAEVPQRVRLTSGPKEEVASLRWISEMYTDGRLSLRKLAAERRVSRRGFLEREDMRAS